MNRFFLLLAAALPLHAHDTWVELNVAKSEPRQPVYADLMLGNHGNNHRDFQLASKIPLKVSTLELIAANGAQTDLIPATIDRGAEEKEGFWTAKIAPPSPGLYCVAHTYDAVVSYAPKRALKSAKAFFQSGDPAAIPNLAFFAKPLGHPLEIIPLSDPTRLYAGDTLQARVLFKGQPLKNVVISCIPRGTELADDFDPNHEARTNDQGEASLPLPVANHYLVVVHRKAPEETGEAYSSGTEYGATLTVIAGEK